MIIVLCLPKMISYFEYFFLYLWGRVILSLFIAYEIDFSFFSPVNVGKSFVFDWTFLYNVYPSNAELNLSLGLSFRE